MLSDFYRHRRWAGSLPQILAWWLLSAVALAQPLPEGVRESIALQLDIAARIEPDFGAQAAVFRRRAATWQERADRGQDPLLAERGKIIIRGYRSPLSELRQGYGIYVPKDYDPARAYPLVVVLHGGSANGNLFLGVVLGNNMSWKQYDRHLWDDFTPRVTPDCIVVAPDGFGQVMWRFMGEQDVLDVIADVTRHYHVDGERVVLLGLSNGGVGAYSIGLRHASRFAAVLAIAGAPSWPRYAGGKLDALQAQSLYPISALSLADNAINTDLRYYHGRTDPGPMRPAYVEEFGKHIAKLGVPYTEKWYDAGHDLLQLVLRHGRLFDELPNVRRRPRPAQVRLVTGDYRAATQHWVTVTRIEPFPSLARVRASASADRLQLATENATELSIDLAQVPLTATRLTVEIDGQALAGVTSSGAPLRLAREHGRWRPGALESSGLVKRPGLSGPITDAYFEPMLHVYGTAGGAALAADLKKTAERGSKGWPLWLWRLSQKVVADTEVTDALLRTHHVVLYGTPGSNRLLERMKDALPISVTRDAVVVGAERFTGAGVGVKLVYPNPLSPARYVIVQAAPTLQGVRGGHSLPDFLPDYVVYDASTTRTRPRLVFSGKQRPRALGYFDARWRLPAPAQGGDPESAAEGRPAERAPIAETPPLPPPPTEFATSPDTAAGKAAREIARRVQTFTNYRSKIPGARWEVEPALRFSIREQEACLAELAALGVKAELWTKPLPTPVAVPVRVTAPVHGVTFRPMHAGAGQVIACELAARLPALAKIVAKYGVHTVHALSQYRDHPYPSFHTLGLALDISRFDTENGALTVKTDFVVDRDGGTCDAPAPPGAKAAALLGIACDLARSRRFSSVLTPNYNAGHRDHFHVDVRPDDPRIFLR